MATYCCRAAPCPVGIEDNKIKIKTFFLRNKIILGLLFGHAMFHTGIEFIWRATQCFYTVFGFSWPHNVFTQDAYEYVQTNKKCVFMIFFSFGIYFWPSLSYSRQDAKTDFFFF